MVVVQFVDNGDCSAFQEKKDENDYDHLLPHGDFDHLCKFTYGRVNSIADLQPEDRHLSTINM